MKEEILKVKEEIQNYIKESKTLQRLEEIRVNYMGKKGIFTELSKKMKDLSAEERPKIGQIINEVKEKINNLLDERERFVIEAFYGINQPEMTLQEIGAKKGLTRERARQIREKAIRKLRKNTQNKLLKSYLGK